MENKVISQAVPSTLDVCPTSLRIVLEAWKIGHATNEELLDASYMAALDFLDAYTKKPMPTLPAEVQEFQHMDALEKRQMSEEAKAKFYRKYEKCFASVRQTTQRNIDHLHWLNTIRAWAESKLLSVSMLQRIDSAIAPHHDHAVDEEPDVPLEMGALHHA